MKFTCERCGKKYATAEDPAPGRVYKLKCKACGHLIVVKASALGAAAPVGGDEPLGARSPAHEPSSSLSIGLEIGTPEPAHVPPRGPASLDATTEVSSAAMRANELELTPRQGDPGYIDLFADVSGVQELPQRPSEDPFLAAARASLPDGYGTGSSRVPDPFAGLRDDISATSAPEHPSRPPPAVPKVPVIPKPKQEKSVVPLVLIGAGVAVMVAILAFVLLSSRKQETPQPVASATPVAPAPVPTPPPAVAAPVETAPPPVVAPAPPVQSAPPKSDDAEKRARAEQKRKEREEADARAAQAKADQKARERADREAKDRAAREAKDRDKADREAKDRAAREAKDRDKAEREARAKAEREAKAQRDRDARESRDREAAEARDRERLARQQAAAEKAAEEPEGGLTQGQIEGVLRSTKTAFDGCIQAARGSDVKLDGRRVMLRLNIQTSGTVTYPTLDDVTLNGTDLGTCLKSAARLMVFPKFKGDTMHVEVPLVMR